MATIAERVQRVLNDEALDRVENVGPQTHLSEFGWEIRPESTAMMVFFTKGVVGLEKEFGIEIPDDDADRFKSVQDILDYLNFIGIKDEEPVSTG